MIRYSSAAICGTAVALIGLVPSADCREPQSANSSPAAEPLEVKVDLRLLGTITLQQPRANQSPAVTIGEGKANPLPPRKVVPRSGWDTITFPPKSKDYVVANLDVRGGFRSCVKTVDAPHLRPVLRNLRLTEGAPYAKDVPNSGTSWGSHCYGWVDGTVEDCVYEDIPGGGYLDAHGLYHMAYGDNRLLRTTFRNLGGQAVQYHFGYKASQPWATRSASLLAEDVTIENTGFHPYMSGHAFTVRGEMYDATCKLRRASIDIEWDKPQERYGWNCKSAGGLVFYGSHYPVGHAEADGWDESRYSFALIELEQVTARLVDPVATILSINGAKEIRLTDCEFRGERTLEKSLGPGVIQIDTDYLGRPGDRPKVQTAVFRGCKGNVPIKLNGETIGTFDELGDFEIKDGKLVR